MFRARNEVVLSCTDPRFHMSQPRVTTQNSCPGDVLWHKRFLTVLVCLTLWRLLYLCLAPLDLSPDEAYYWDWSRQLAPGYYSKPPMVAWINALSTGALGNRAWVVRLPAALLSAVALWALYQTARTLFDSRTAFWAAVISVASAGTALLGLVMTIDAPLMCFWVLTLLFVAKAVKDSEGALRWWLLAGIFGGLGFLSKQMLASMPPAVFAFLAVSKTKRRLLATPGPYLFAVLTIGALAPVLYWNWQNDWITLQHTGHHFEHHGHSILFGLQTFLEFVLSQLFVFSPVMVVLLCVLSFGIFRRFSRISDEVRLLFFTGPLPLLFVALISLRQRTHPNWPAVYYASSSILLAAWFCRDLGPVLEPSRRWRRLFKPGVIIGAALAGVLYLAPFVYSLTPLRGSSVDPLRRLWGWRELGIEVGQRITDVPRPDKTFLLFGQRQPASAVAFYAPGQPEVYMMSSAYGNVSNQYDIWGGPIDKTGWDALLIIDLKPRQTLPPRLLDLFERVEEQDPIVAPPGKESARSYHVFLGTKMKSWPREAIPPTPRFSQHNEAQNQ